MGSSTVGRRMSRTSSADSIRRSNSSDGKVKKRSLSETPGGVRRGETLRDGLGDVIKNARQPRRGSSFDRSSTNQRNKFECHFVLSTVEGRNDMISAALATPQRTKNASPTLRRLENFQKVAHESLKGDSSISKKELHKMLVLVAANKDTSSNPYEKGSSRARLFTALKEMVKADELLMKAEAKPATSRPQSPLATGKHLDIQPVSRPSSAESTTTVQQAEDDTDVDMWELNSDYEYEAEYAEDASSTVDTAASGPATATAASAADIESEMWGTESDYEYEAESEEWAAAYTNAGQPAESLSVSDAKEYHPDVSLSDAISATSTPRPKKKNTLRRY